MTALLADINRSIHPWQSGWSREEGIWRNELWRKRGDQVDARFAALNGWKETQRHFDIPTLAAGKCWGNQYINVPYPLWDHPRLYRQGRKTIAIALHSYADDATKKWQEVLDRLNLPGPLVANSPPNPWASTYLPGGTIMVVLTRPETPVLWLPDQLEYSEAPE